MNWLTTGAPLTTFDNQIVTRVLRGVATLRHDPRVAFLLLLPDLPPPTIFNCPLSSDHLLYKAATIFGIFGMLRFGTFAKLTPQSIILVSASGDKFTHLV